MARIPRREELEWRAVFSEGRKVAEWHAFSVTERGETLVWRPGKRIPSP